ncbi:LuxR C-terminal-related transcriptional regulator [Demequina maris]|uniref:LuxR C-terminal-related transcriptional regulator n=1 Tax=Demequina maris TaxID=1638982 RepID=UPI000785C23E|nr:response regulator transcription factor [Demequina maris]
MKVVIVEDAVLLREGLARLLDSSGIAIVGTADNPTTALAEIRRTMPDAVVLDIRLPPSRTDEGITLARALRAEFPSLGILLLSQYLEAHYAAELLASAPVAMGYLLKDRVGHVGVLVDALERVVVGECVIDPAIVTMLLRRPHRDDPLAALTDRERDVLALIAEGRSNAAIASHLSLSEKTIETHVSQILQKLGIGASAADNRRVLAVLAYLQRTS